MEKEGVNINRAIPKKMTKEEVEGLLSIIPQTFSSEFLDKDADNPISRLWNRADVISTIELTTLSDAIIKAKKHNLKWLKDNLKDIESNNRNNQKAAICELLFASYINDIENSEIKYPKHGQKNYDLEYKNENELKISIKSLGLSSHRAQINENFEKLKDFFVSFLKKTKTNQKTLFLVFKKYPANVNETFNEIIKKCNDNGTFDLESENYRCSLLNQTSSNNECFDVLSYSIIVLCPHHKHEGRKATQTTIDEIEKLSKLKGKFLLYVKLDQDIPIKKFLGFLKLELDRIKSENKDISNIECIIHQPYIGFEEDLKTTTICHFIKPDVFGVGFAYLNFLFPPGRISYESDKNLMIVFGNEIDISEYYVFQEGKMTIHTDKDEFEIPKIGVNYNTSIIKEINGRRILIELKPIPDYLEIL